MGVGWQELILVAIVFLALISPEKLENLAGFLGKTIGSIKRQWNKFILQDLRKKKLIG